VIEFLLSRIYKQITSIRNSFYESGIFSIYHSKLKVISVGNLSVGGNSKTPLCIYLAQVLSARGFKPVILSRGYGAKIRGASLVGPNDSAEAVGDEPCLMAKQYGLKVVVAPDRVLGAKFIEKEALGDLIILDDGFQHRRLHRDLDILSVNCDSLEAEEAFLAGRLLPWGRFREDRDLALRRAQIVVFAERGPERLRETPSKLLSLLPSHIRAFRSFLRPAAVVALNGERKLSPGKAVAFCGIANPEGFFRTLTEFGFELEERVVFSDHYRFSAAEIDALLAKYPGLPLICTEKDAIKIVDQGLNIYKLKVELEIKPGDAFIVQIERALAKKTEK